MNRLVLIAMVIAAMILSAIPVVRWPFNLLETFFHEISHGLAAILTGGSIDRIELHWRGSGLCYTRGGIRFFISFAGYAGAVVWGAMIYLAATATRPRHATGMATFLAIVVGASTLLWMRDPISLIIGSALTGLFVVAVKWGTGPLLRPALQFCGLYVLLDAVRSPMHQLYALSSDSHTLARMTMIPSVVWIATWIGIGLGGFYYVWKHAEKARGVLDSITPAPQRTSAAPVVTQPPPSTPSPRSTSKGGSPFDGL
ncbi:MAG: M50 family metallopeptidase [Magnetococcales bacterium]|nr:M50 family metallopeptidase [Magnetococcales bacterium]